MTERDITAFVLSDELTLSATVGGLRIEYGAIDEIGDDQCFRIPEGIGSSSERSTLPATTPGESCARGRGQSPSLKAPPGRYQNIDGCQHWTTDIWFIATIW